MKDKLNIKYGEWIIFCIILGEVYSLTILKTSVIYFLMDLVNLLLTYFSGAIPEEVGFMNTLKMITPHGNFVAFINFVLSRYIIVPSFIYIIFNHLLRMDKGRQEK